MGACLNSRVITNCKTEPQGAGKARLSAANRRKQLLSTAAAQFSRTGYHATTTLVLARAAGVSEPVLYTYYPSKELLFREVVKANSESRVHALRLQLSSLTATALPECIRELAETTISVCFSAGQGPLITNWALLELPDFSADLHRQEIAAVASMWQAEISRRETAARTRLMISSHLIPCAVHACYAYAFWLAALRHSRRTAAPLVVGFAEQIRASATPFLQDSSMMGLSGGSVAECRKA
jgi:AcrR family transcriptional regulator